MDNVVKSLEVTSEFREPFRLHIVSTISAARCWRTASISIKSH